MRRSRPKRVSTSRGTGSPGRRSVAATDARAISKRLGQFIAYRYGSRYQFINQRHREGWSHSTVTGWFGKSPRVPDPAALLRLAKEENLSLDWLFLGEGPMLREQVQTSEALGDRVRARLVAELKASHRAADSEINVTVPPGDGLLARLIGEYGRQLELNRALVASLARTNQGRWKKPATDLHLLPVSDLIGEPVRTVE